MVAKLKDMCGGFALGKSGNKTALLDRLKDFSAHPDEWEDRYVHFRWASAAILVGCEI